MDYSKVIRHCRRVRKNHPKTVFVIFPLCSEKIGRDLSGFEADLQTAVLKNELPNLKLSYGNRQEYYRDFAHLTMFGIAATQSELASFVRTGAIDEK
jgi:hypothetical protein